MKKLLLLTAAFAVMLFTSCEKEETAPAAKGTTVTYSVELPAIQTKAGTKAIGDGFNVNQLVYEVWKTDSENQRNLQEGVNATRLYQEKATMSKIDGEQKCVITLDLVHDQNYTILFWAQYAENNVSPYYNTSNLISVGYKNLGPDGVPANYKSNHENMAAFYGAEFINFEDVETAPMRRAVLKRPFAQLNIGTKNTPEDYIVTMKSSTVTIKDVPTVFNVAENVTPEVAEEYGIEPNTAVSSEKTFVFDYNDANTNYALPTDPNMLVVNNTNYHYVAMNYVFAPSHNVTVDYAVKATLTADKGTGTETSEVVVSNTVVEVPLKENYRTNIVGNLLSSTAQYEVVIDASWDKNDTNWEGNVVEVWDKKYIQEPQKVDGVYQISLASELAWFAAQMNVETKAATVDVTRANFKLVEDIDLAGALWNPIGIYAKKSGERYSGTFDGNGKTIKNLTVKTEGKASAGLFASSTGTIKDLNIDGATIEGHYMTGVIIGDAQAAKIEGCTVNNATVISTPFNKDDANHVGGIAGYLTEPNVYIKNCTVTNSTITGFRDVAGIVGSALQKAVVTGNTVSNVTITADQTADYVNNDKDGNAGEIAGRVSTEATIADNTIGENVVVNRKVNSSEELAYAVKDAKSGDIINIFYNENHPNYDFAFPTKDIKSGVTLNFEEGTYVGNQYNSLSLNVPGATIIGARFSGYETTVTGTMNGTFKNCYFEGPQALYMCYVGDNLSFEDCTFDGIVYSAHFDGGENPLTFTRCTFNGWNAFAAAITELNFIDCEFISKDYCERNAVRVYGKTTFSGTTFNFDKVCSLEAICIDGANENPENITFTNCTVLDAEQKELSLFSYLANYSEGDKITVDGNVYTLSEEEYLTDEQGRKIIATVDGLKTALSKAQNNDVIYLADGIYDGLFQVGSKNITLKSLNSKGAEIAGRICVAGTPTSTFTCEDLKFSISANTAAKVNNTYYDKTANYMLGNYGGNVIARNCDFSGMNDSQGAIYYYANTAGASTVEKFTVEGCTFNGKRAIRSRANISVKDCKFFGLEEDCVDVLGFGESTSATTTVEFVNNESTTAVNGVCIKTGNYATKNIIFNVSGNTKCNSISFDSKNVNNLYPETYKFEGEVKGISPEDGAGLNYLISNANVTDIKLLPGVVYEGIFNVKSDCNIASLDATNKATIKGRIEIINTGSSFKNLKFDFNDDSKKEFSSLFISSPKTHPAIVGIHGAEGNIVSFENCEYVFKSGYNFEKAPGAITHYTGAKLIIKDCIFDGEGNPIYAKTNLEMTGCTVKMYGNNAVLTMNYTAPGKLIFKNNTIQTKSTNPTNSPICGIQFLSTNTYNKLYVDIKNNTGIDIPAVGTSKLTDVEYEAGSDTF